MDPLSQAILDYIRKEYLEADDDREIGLDTPLITGGFVDSFSMVSLKRFLERQNEIAIPDAEATPAAFDSVRSIVHLVQRIAARKAPAVPAL